MCPLEYAELSTACAGMPLKGKLKPAPWWLWGSGSTAVICAEVQVGFEVAVFSFLSAFLSQKGSLKGQAGMVALLLSVREHSLAGDWSQIRVSLCS